MVPRSERITRVVNEEVMLPESNRNSSLCGDSEASWFSGYEAQLRLGGLSKTACDVIRTDALYIANKGVYGAGRPRDDNEKWPAERLRRGLVVGSIQSGKTASMLGVTAASLDMGTDVVVLLTGTRTALWLQTAVRTLRQLDLWTPECDAERRQRRVLVPDPSLIVGGRRATEIGDLYHETPNYVRRQLVKGRPLIAIVMKQGDHLMRFGSYLRNIISKTTARMDRPLHLLLIDDEADDGSILDAVVESGLGADSEELKQVPRHIAQVWSGSGPNHTTFDERLYATYLAYTATPQANILQSDHNPLAPTEYVIALRTPMDSGSVGPPRATTYEEPEGLRSYYTGGEIFYRRLSDDSGRLVYTTPFPERGDYSNEQEYADEVDSRRAEMLGNALRAYFVAAACSLFISGKKMSTTRKAEPSDIAHIQNMSPSPISMLVHPSSRQDDHFEMAGLVAAWSNSIDLSTYDPRILDRDEYGLPELSVDGLVARLEKEDDEWVKWLSDYESTRDRMMYLPGGDVQAAVPIDKWPEIKRLLIEEVFPYTRLAVINSNPRADDRPEFEPHHVGSERYLPARDLFTIFVSGNVMARGITIEGLVTSLFLRNADQPTADTQMQMQRWFGYRGTYLRWCRVLLFEDQLDLFRQYHEADEAMRAEIITEMNKSADAAPSPMVLQGAGYRATGKIANIQNLPLCPGAVPFVRVVDHGDYAAVNNAVLSRLLRDESWQDVVVGGTVRGQAMGRQMTLLEVACILEQFRYTHHDPDPAVAQNDRWRSLGSELGLDEPLFRPPGRGLGQAVPPPSCPYSIAAYLRLWNSVLTLRARGLYPTDDRLTPWSMLDLNVYRENAPQFYVGIRYGSAGLSNDPALSEYGIKCMLRHTEDGVIGATWGSRNPGDSPGSYLGDQLFDYHIHGLKPPNQIPGEPLWRPRGDPGLLLFHILKPAEEDMNDGVTLGLALPLGGPDHFAALRPSFTS